MRFGIFRKGAGVLALTFLAATAATAGGSGQPGAQRPATAQPTPTGPTTVPAQQPPEPQLDIPQDVSFVGSNQGLNVIRASAIVNDEIITRSDIDQRLALFLASQPGVQIPADEMERLRAQVLRNLIDEALQIQAAKEREIEIDRRDIDRYYARFAQQFGHDARSFSDYLRTIGASERTVKRQIEGEIAWTQLRRRLPSLSATEEEVSAILNSLLASRGAPEYHVAEIFMYASPETAAQVRQRLGQISQQIRAGGNFAAYARQFSEASTAAVGGDLGWVKAEQLPAELATVVQQMPVGALSDPIQLPDGLSLVYVRDSRRVLAANPRDAVLTLMQVSIDLPPGTQEATARQRAEQLAQTTQAMGGCGRAEAAAASIGATVVSGDGRRIREFPAVLQEMLVGMNVGQVTPPFGTTERVSVLVLCGRDDPEATPDPTRQTVAEAIQEQRMARQAQRLLRDLRRDAVIEYR